MPSKEFYAKHKERYKEQHKKWTEENKEYVKEYNKEWREENKEYKQKYYEKNKERIKQKDKEYSQTDKGKKSHRISTWKRYGLICEDYDKIYEIYVNTNECDNCGIELIEGMYCSNKKCIDHSHKTGLFRNILCHKCNTIRHYYEPD